MTHADQLAAASGAVHSFFYAKRLQLRLHHFLEHQSTDSGLQGASDEVYLSALGLDSFSVTKGADGSAHAPLYIAPRIGDVTDNAVRGPWATNPLVFIDWDLLQFRSTAYPRTFTVTLLVVEHDNADLAKAFDALYSQVGSKVRQIVVDTAAVAAGALAGAAVGSVIPGIGSLVGAAIGAAAGGGFDAAVAEIRSGLADDIFTPIPITVTMPSIRGHLEEVPLDVEQSLHIRQYGAHYEMGYSWHTVY